ncbi:AAA family ATPase [Rhodococcus kronopolitis]|uniref:Nuclease SbcCD subunit C n=1 Tax=Rhodococcus kronopolitis TaxID=1460226 RepID=A0ABV9FYC8_9NOCA
MRLHSLEVTAFGPFGDTATVDFDELGADGLFLLHGQTGAGKTTVLDAVAFALYGTVPGARQQGKRLLSDHAAPGAVPRVTLEATIGGRRLRLTRSPEYQRPKLRGTGTTKENAKATLEWLDGHGQNLTRLDEIGEAVGRLLGMSADQFFQVVLLPQGDFARFLRADTDERGNLLERLFDTSRFGTVEDWFVARRRESAAKLEASRKSVDLMVARVSTAAGIEAGADAEPLVWARKLEIDAGEVASQALLDLAEAEAAAAATGAALAEDRRVLRLQQRAAQAAAELADHEAAAPARARVAGELAGAQRAAPVAALREQETVAAQVAGRELARLTDLADRIGASDEGAELLARLSWPPAPTDSEVLAAAVRDWAGEVARLDGLIVESQTGDALAGAVLDHRLRRGELCSAETELARRRELLPELVQTAEAELAAARLAAATVPALAAARTAASEALAAATELAAARRARTAAAQELADARDRHLRARGELLDLRERRLAGMAAELAAELVDGDPCVVCGAAEHPRPAERPDSVVTKADEESARVAEQACSDAVDAASARLTKVELAVEVQIERGGDGDPNELKVRVAETSARHAEAAALADGEPALTTALAELRAESSGLQERAGSIAAELAALDAQIDSAETQLAQIRARVDAATGAGEGLRTRRDRLDGLAGAASGLRDQRLAAASARDAADALTRTVAGAAAEAGFDTVEAAVDAVREARRIATMEESLRAARDLEVRVGAVLAEPDTAAAVLLEPSDPADAEAADLAATIAVKAAVGVAADAQRRQQDLERLVGQLAAEVEALAPAQARHDELAGLADVIEGRGQNARKMSLRSYVLAARLEEVALSASTRLRRMSAGRYEFVHADGAGTGRKRGGLGLDIRDDYTGVVRSAKTLSGGESFLASLALALGLADVVAAESGGLVLDTMFIDEGFGTLDADTLESVMGVLDELREGGRVVGIVSHVDEMRQRIPSRLHVIRGRTGSSLEVVAG